MTCKDWVCGKFECKLNNNISNSFQYRMCSQCRQDRELRLCRTCIYGQPQKVREFFCKKDNTYGFSC